MGLSISLQSDFELYDTDIDTPELSLIFSNVDINNEQKAALNLLFSIGNRHASREDILDALRICKIFGKRITTSIIYSLSGHMSDGTLFSKSRGVGGIRIGGEIFSVRAGINRCILQKIKVKDDGQGEIVSQKDLRDSRTLETDNMGIIRINHRRTPSHLLRFFDKAEKFVSKLSPKTKITIIVG